jgi:hypothetical protein
LKPEFLNRLMVIVLFFSPLVKDDLTDIRQRAREERNLDLTLNERVRLEGASQAAQFDVLQLRRAAQHFLDDNISDGGVGSATTSSNDINGQTLESVMTPFL